MTADNSNKDLVTKQNVFLTGSFLYPKFSKVLWFKQSDWILTFPYRNLISFTFTHLYEFHYIFLWYLTKLWRIWNLGQISLSVLSFEQHMSLRQIQKQLCVSFLSSPEKLLFQFTHLKKDNCLEKHLVVSAGFPRSNSTLYKLENYLYCTTQQGQDPAKLKLMEQIQSQGTLPGSAELPDQIRSRETQT